MVHVLCGEILVGYLFLRKRVGPEEGIYEVVVLCCF